MMKRKTMMMGRMDYDEVKDNDNGEDGI